MSLISSLIKIFVGDKAKKDMKEIAPLVEQINAHQKQYKSLSNDELRAKTTAFKERITAARSEFEQKIQSLKTQADATDDIDQKEDFYTEIDKLTDEAYKAGEKVLNEILPEAFAVVKETAQRFVDNPTIEVTASAYDRELASLHEGLCKHRGRQSPLEKLLGCCWKGYHLGYGTLRCTAHWGDCLAPRKNR